LRTTSALISMTSFTTSGSLGQAAEQLGMLTNELIQSFAEGHTGCFFFLEDADKLSHRFLLLAGERGN